LTEAEKRALQRKSIDDMLFMGRACWPKLFELDSPEFHKDLRDTIQNPNIAQFNRLAPRGHAKTTVAALVAPLWKTYAQDAYLGRKRRPHFILLVSKSLEHAKNLLSTIKDALEFSQEFRALFGYHGPMTAKMWTTEQVITGYGDIFTCRGMGQLVRGLNIRGRRPDYGILDDAEDENNTKTIEAMASNQRWVLGGLAPAMAKGGQLGNIGTPQHQRGLVNTLSEMADWNSKTYQAITTDDEGVRHALWPAMRDLAWLDEKKAALEGVGKVSMFYREYQCEVVGDEDQMFLREDIVYWEGDFIKDTMGRHYLDLHMARGVEYPEPRRIAVNLFMGVDPASSLEESADYSVVLLLAVDADKNRYVVYVYRKRVKPVDLGDEIIRMYHEYTPVRTQVETTGYQEMLRDYIKRESRVFIPGMELKNQDRKKKTRRIEGLQPLFRGKKVHLRKVNGKLEPSMEALLDELMLFPRASHDDTCDGLWLANKGCYPPYHDVSDHSEPEKRAVEAHYYDWQVE
jgi:phage terminase large subunit-like protein